jgi:hypothetical protein
VFGGLDANGAVLDDTWTYTGTWTQHAPAVRPPGRYGHTLVSDFTRRRVVLFGGFDANQQPLGDVWEWDGSAWHQRLPVAGPAPRGAHAMTWVQDLNRVAVFGGSGANQDLWLYGTDFVPTTRTVGFSCVWSEAGPNELQYRSPVWAWLGGTIAAQASGVGLVYIVGLSDTAWAGHSLPLELAPWLGRTGCLLRQSLDLVLPAGGSSLVLPVPDDIRIAGLHVYVQAAGLLHSYSNTLLAGVTNGLAYRIGAL